MTPTEQQQVCISNAIEFYSLKIEACAGAGKTSTLKLIADNLDGNSLYMAFNKVTATEAMEKFPPHVTCQTTHSIAYQLFGRPLHQKLKRPTGGYVNVASTGSEIAKYYKLHGVCDIQGKTVATPNAMGLFVRRTVERFEQSADAVIEKHHLPKKDMEKAIEADGSIVTYVLATAKKLWKDRIHIGSPVLATHDTYLKLYQLSKPHLPYNNIYLDEGQDTTPCVLDIFLNQTHAKRIMVGDRRQAIYAWRGAVNAMQMVDCACAPLSKSFRYGNGIAAVASAVLHYDMTITGRDDLESVIGFGVVDRTKPHMYLFRTNTALLYEAVRAVDRGEKVKIEIDVRDFVKLLESALALFSGDMKNVKHEMLLPYATWAAFMAEAKEIGGGELPRIANMVNGGSARHVIDVLSSYQSPEEAIATYTSAHKAKGREEYQVILADDFPSNYKDGKWVGMSTSDENLVYVACTRSMHILEINTPVAEIMDKYGLPYIRPAPGHITEECLTDEFQQEEEKSRLTPAQFAEYNTVRHIIGLHEDSPPWNQ